jgi:hypothetical protein
VRPICLHKANTPILPIIVFYASLPLHYILLYYVMILWLGQSDFFFLALMTRLFNTLFIIASNADINPLCLYKHSYSITNRVYATICLFVYQITLTPF